MIVASEVHKKIIDILKERGPSLPIQIAKQTGIDSLFISAFLSELVNEKKIKISHLKVGGSPLYFLEGQEQRLEEFCHFLHPKEGEAFELLKKNKILKDSEQEPSIRVALRSIKDFSFGFKKNEEIYWRYFLAKDFEINESEIKEEKVPETIIKPKRTEEIDIKKPGEKEKTIIDKKKIAKKAKEKDTNHFENPLIIKKDAKIKPQSEFVKRIIALIRNKFEIIEEKEHKIKEYNCIIKINSNLGSINFLTQAKDKKKISEKDLKNLLSDAQKIPLPAFLIHTGELSKKAKEFADKYSSVLKVKKTA